MLLPTLAGMGWLIARTYAAERQANERTLSETSRALAQVVDATLERYATVARVLARSSELDEAPALDMEELTRFEQRARRALVGQAGWVELRDIRGVLLSTHALGASDGHPAAGTALATDGHVKPLQQEQDQRASHAAIVEPVLRDGQAVLNVVVAVPPIELQRVIDRQDLPPDWVATVLDQRGIVVARHPGGLAYVGRSATPDLLQTISKQPQGPFESVSLDGMPTIGYHSRTRRGWTFLVAMPRSEFAARPPTAVVQVALGALTLLGLSVALAIGVARRIARPVQHLELAAAQMRAGELVPSGRTGIAECDAVRAALVDASTSLKHGREELEQRVAEAVQRTRAAEQLVSQHQRMEALGRLTGGVAHDFNNLLGIIGNNAHLIQRHAQAPQVQAQVAATLRAVEAGSRLTQHLQRIARRRSVSPRHVALARWLPELQEMLRGFLGHGIETSVQIERDTRPVHVDPGELELALINLALNARDAMPHGGELRLRVRSAQVGEAAGLLPGDYVLLTVGDDGQGMDAETVAHVFEPFFTTKPMGKGTGLGLSQVHGFCVQAGGTARMDSTPGLGTTVTLVLPAAAHADAEAAAGAAASAVIAHVEPASLAGASVLLVEDDAELADVTTALLEAHGATVAHAADADAALVLLRAGGSVDVVLSDVVMPGAMDGVALAHEVRRIWPSLPLVLISGYVGRAAQAHDFTVLRKPCAPQALLAALRDAMAGRGAAVNAGLNADG